MGLKTYEKKDNKYIISFHVSAEEFPEVLDTLRSLQGRKFDAVSKTWSADATLYNEQLLHNIGFVCAQPLVDKISNLKNKPAFKHINTALLPKEMYPYQIKAVEFLEAHNGVALIGDDMGCISGDCGVYITTHDKLRDSWRRRHLPLKQLYKAFAEHRLNRLTTFVYGMTDTSIKLQPLHIKSISYNGKATTYTITTATGRTVRATADHLFYRSSDGWVPLDHLKVGDLILVKSMYDVTVVEDTIVAIEEYGDEDVYDIALIEGHNFLAGGVLVHNCGKTLEVLGYCNIHKDEFKKVLIVCPPTLKYVWENEIKKWLHLPCQIIHTSNDTIYDYKYTIIPYSLLDVFIPDLMKRHFDLIIGDEIHYIANSNAIRTKAFKKIARRIKKRIFLSGTPIRNYPANFFNALNLIAPDIFNNRKQYLLRYCDYKYNGFAWVAKGATNVDELHELISPFMIRRTKEEVLPELPVKNRIIVPLDMDNLSEQKYVNATQSFIKWAEEKQRAQLNATHMETLKQIAYLGKRNQVISWIEDFLDTGRKLVVFIWNKDVAKDIYDSFKGIAVVLTGDTPDAERQKNIEKFQNDPNIRLFIGQIISAGVGITLTAASDVAFVQFPYTPSEVLQAEDRCLRIGQRNTVFVYYLVATNTIEETIATLIERKFKTINKIIDGKDTSLFEGGDFLDVLSQEILKRHG